MNKHFKLGERIDFGEVVLSENDIIEFAQQFDPLDIHIDIEKANKSIFKGLVASGPHLFNVVYRTLWLPLFKDTVICGLEVNNWKLLKPIYANHKIHSTVSVSALKENKVAGHVIIKWLFEFKNEQEEMAQCLDITIMHKNG